MVGEQVGDKRTMMDKTENILANTRLEGREYHRGEYDEYLFRLVV